MSHERTELQKEVVEALVASKAVNFEAIGTVLSKYAARAAVTGTDLGVIINHRVWDICIPVDFFEVIRGINPQIAQGSFERQESFAR